MPNNNQIQYDYKLRGQGAWEEWLNDEKYQSILAEIEVFYTELCEDENEPDYFTPHDSSHCLAVEKLVKALIKKSKIELSEMEKFILFVCVWTHDLGMLYKTAKAILDKNYKIDTKRNQHEEIGAKYISTKRYNREFIKIFKRNGINENFAITFINTINLINKFHRRKYPITECPKYRYIKGEKIRSNLLATLLRLADTLHIDTTRFDRKTYDILQIGNFDRTSRLHWLKSFVVSAVYLDIEQQTIFIVLDIPELSSHRKKNIEENVHNLKSMIYEDIYEDMISSQIIFKEYNLPFYSMVTVEINYIMGMDENLADEVYGILNDLHILLSPSTSKVIRKALDSIVSLADMEFDNMNKFKTQIALLLNNLEKVHEHRPCHVGLKRIINMLSNFYKDIPQDGTENDIIELQKDLRNKVDTIRQRREDAIQTIKKKACQLEEKQVKNIVLFGISEIVSQFLNNCSRKFKENVNIFIFECGSKRQFSLSNNLEYNDGIQYSLLLSNYGYKRIFILPDNAIATLFADIITSADDGTESENSKEETIILFGANGIDLSLAESSLKNSSDEYICFAGHSSGHLALAIVAKHYQVPIWIVTDTFKFTDKEEVKKIEWQPTLEREGTLWLTGQRKWLDELRKRNIVLKNYREDKIPISLIEQIITEADWNPTSRCS